MTGSGEGGTGMSYQGQEENGGMVYVLIILWVYMYLNTCQICTLNIYSLLYVNYIAIKLFVRQFYIYIMEQSSKVKINEPG